MPVQVDMSKLDFSKVNRKVLPKLKEIILYICQQSEGDVRFGAVKLNKILYFSDFIAYRELGESITGATYQHLHEGPAPKELLKAQTELKAAGAVHFEQREYFNHPHKRMICTRKPDMSLFKHNEVAIVDKVMEELRPMNAIDISLLSHREWGWKLTDVGDTIEYRTAWLSPEPLTQEQIARGIALWKGRGAN